MKANVTMKNENAVMNQTHEETKTAPTMTMKEETAKEMAEELTKSGAVQEDETTRKKGTSQHTDLTATDAKDNKPMTANEWRAKMQAIFAPTIPAFNPDADPALAALKTAAAANAVLKPMYEKALTDAEAAHNAMYADEVRSAKKKTLDETLSTLFSDDHKAVTTAWLTDIDYPVNLQTADAIKAILQPEGDDPTTIRIYKTGQRTKKDKEGNVTTLADTDEGAYKYTTVTAKDAAGQTHTERAYYAEKETDKATTDDYINAIGYARSYIDAKRKVLGQGKTAADYINNAAEAITKAIQSTSADSAARYNVAQTLIKAISYFVGDANITVLLRSLHDKEIQLKKEEEETDKENDK